MKNTWQLQEAKDQLSVVVDKAMTRGPQTITRHGEPERGIRKVSDTARRSRLQRWLSDSVLPWFGERILVIDQPIVARWGDALIAATALHHQLTVATRNTRDLKRTGVPTCNPWASP